MAAAAVEAAGAEPGKPSLPEPSFHLDKPSEVAEAAAAAAGTAVLLRPAFHRGRSALAGESSRKLKVRPSLRQEAQCVSFPSPFFQTVCSLVPVRTTDYVLIDHPVPKAAWINPNCRTS